MKNTHSIISSKKLKKRQKENSFAELENHTYLNTDYIREILYFLFIFILF